VHNSLSGTTLQRHPVPLGVQRRYEVRESDVDLGLQWDQKLNFMTVQYYKSLEQQLVNLDSTVPSMLYVAK
jgi:hypothetical protein